MSDQAHFLRVASGLRRASWRLCWSHWTSLGVSGRVPMTELPLDVEALVVFAARLAHGEPRMTDAVLDWLLAFDHLVNRDRLASMIREVGQDDPMVPGLLAKAGASTEPGLIGAGAPSLARESRHKAWMADMSSSARVCLRLRSLCGPTTRADILAALAGGREPTPMPGLLVWTKVSRAATGRAVAGLAAARFVEVVSISARDNRVRLPADSPLAGWLSQVPPMRDWASRYLVLLRVLALYERLATDERVLRVGDHATAHRVLAHELLTSTARIRARSGIGGPSLDTPAAALLSAFEAWADRLPAEVAELPGDAALTASYYATAPLLHLEARRTAEPATTPASG